VIYQQALFRTHPKTDVDSRFCRKTTMVKHSRRAHHNGGGPVDPDPESEDEDDQSPLTPSAPHAPWMNNAYMWPMPQAHRNMMPNQNMHYGRVNSLGSNGPEYQPNHHNDEFAQHREMMQRLSYQGPVYGQPKPFSVPSQHDLVSQVTPPFKVEPVFDAYQAHQPRTTDIHNSPGSHYSALSPTTPTGHSDAYTHQQPTPLSTHVPQSNGQPQQLAYDGPQQQSTQQSMVYYQPDNIPNVTRNMLDAQSFQPTSGPMVPTPMPMMASSPIEVATYGENSVGLTAFHNHVHHPMQTYSLPRNTWMMGMKEASGMLLPHQRYQHNIQQ